MYRLAWRLFNKRIDERRMWEIGELKQLMVQCLVDAVGAGENADHLVTTEPSVNERHRTEIPSTELPW